MYTVDAATGALASAGAPALIGDEGAGPVAVSPDGRFVYVASWGEGDTAGSVSAYTINRTTGALTFTAIARAPCVIYPGSCAPWSVAVHPSGRFAYVANEGGFVPTSVTMYAIDATSGTLTFMGLVATAGGGRAGSVEVDPSGKFAYVTESTDGLVANCNISTYIINTTTGALTAAGTMAMGSGFSSIAFHPSGKFAYVTNADSNDVSTYIINTTTGALTAAGTVAAGSGPASIAIHPSGKFAYVTNVVSNEVSTYIVNTTTGALTFAGTVAVGSGPGSIAIHPSGKFAYYVGSNDVWTYSIDPVTGALALIASIGT
jgi:YVTN family beta-propeller protein